MAKTIKELAKENIPPMGWYHFQDEAKECFCDGFEAGANAVLEEIYGVFNNIFEGVRKGEMTTVNQVVNPILERMKELKGE